MDFILGAVAAAVSPIFMVIGFVLWERFWKSTSLNLNIFKGCLSSLVFLLLCLVFSRHSFLDATEQEIFYLCWSAVLGVIIGDSAWLYALKAIGSAKIILIDALKPFIGALFGHWFLQETLNPFFILGIAVTTIGIVLVSLEESKEFLQDDNVEDLDDPESLQGSQPNPQLIETPHIPLEISPRNFEYALPESEHEVCPKTSTASAKDVLGSRYLTSDVEIVDHNIGSPRLPDDSLSRTSPSIRNIIHPNTKGKLGYICGILNVLLDAYGSYLTKRYGDNMSTFDVNFWRYGSSTIFMILGLSVWNLYFYPFHSIESSSIEVFNSHGETPSTVAQKVSMYDLYKTLSTNEGKWLGMSRREVMLTTLGVLFVGFMNPALANYALLKTSVGLQMTLTSLGPLYSLPILAYVKNDAISFRVYVGSLLTILGVAVLCFSHY